MTCLNFNDLKNHVGHKIVCTNYDDKNICVECETCYEVLYEEFSEDAIKEMNK